MRQIIIFISIFIFFWNLVYWNENLAYTIIDCIDWDDKNWEAFKQDKPFQSLKLWIENTINYINTNINKDWNENTSSWKLFEIKVNCSMNNIIDNTINIDFLWTKYNNFLQIEWIWDNSFIIENIKFNLSKDTWNIIFKNATFKNYNYAYFYDYIKNWAVYPKWSTHPNWNGIKIIDSYIYLKNNNNIWQKTNYKFFKYYYYPNTNYYNLSHYTNWQVIENSIIDIEIKSDYNFRLPVIIKNSNINFTNLNWTWSYNINFIEEWNKKNTSKLDYSVLTSNEINFWGNNFISDNSSNLTYINNKFYNFSNFNFSINTICFNNYIENDSRLDISNSINLFNNVFKNEYIDTYDIYNLRKNYKLDNIWPKWISWVYKKHNNLDLFNIKFTSSSLYEEVTWQKVPELKNSVYVIYEN